MNVINMAGSEYGPCIKYFKIVFSLKVNVKKQVPVHHLSVSSRGVQKDISGHRMDEVVFYCCHGTT